MLLQNFKRKHYNNKERIFKDTYHGLFFTEVWIEPTIIPGEKGHQDCLNIGVDDMNYNIFLGDELRCRMADQWFEGEILYSPQYFEFMLVMDDEAIPMRFFEEIFVI